MKLTDIKYEVIDHDYESLYNTSCGYIYASILPSKTEIMKHIAKVDYYASFLDTDKLTLVLPEGSLPGSIYLVWNDSHRTAYTLRPVK